MAIRGVHEGNLSPSQSGQQPPHLLESDGSRSPPYKRKGSPDESLYADPPSSRYYSSTSSFAASGAALRGSPNDDRPSSNGHHHSHSHGHTHTHTHSHSHSHSQNQSHTQNRSQQHEYHSQHQHHPYDSHHGHPPYSPRNQQDSPMPASNSEDEDDDIRHKKRRLASSSSKNYRQSAQQQQQPTHQTSPSSPALNPNGSSAEVMDQVRTTLKLKQQQKAIIESRQHATTANGATPTSSSSPPASSSASSAQQPPSKVSSSSPSSQPVTEKTSSGISIFHGSATFAALNRRPLPLTSPKNPKNAKSLTIFAPSYSESSLSIQSAPLQPSHGHGRPLGGHHSHLATQHNLHHHPLSSMNPRTSQPLGLHHKQPHPFSQHSSQPRSPTKTSSHAKKASRVLLRQSHHDHSNSGTLPAPILSSHTGPLPSPMYPPPHHGHPSTPFLTHHHQAAVVAAAAAAASQGPLTSTATSASTLSSSKHVFMETLSGLYDSVDSTKSLKFTLEEQIRKSAQLLQTLQASGTMIESLVRGQFKELEKGVIERFENELEHLAVRVKALEEHQGLLTPSAPVQKSTTATQAAPLNSRAQSSKACSSSAMTGVTSTSAAQSRSLPSPPSHSGATGSNNGTLPTPPFSKNQGEELASSGASPMEVEDDGSADVTATTPPHEKAHSTEYHSSVKKLQERVADLEKKSSSNGSSGGITKSEAASSGTTAVVASS
ncbi:hypothetical protein BG004_000688 [Podila humilis]|nr:hypothetical protein BG004_000688 [Podila humilis]